MKLKLNLYLGIPSQKNFFIGAGVLAIICTALLLYLNKPELVPQLWTSIVVAILSYWACTFTAEKLRLDLFDRRFEIYKNTLEYCSTVFAYASLERRDENREQIDRAIEAAHQSFRGIGYHKTKALFGDDIVTPFNQLNTSYAYISTFGNERARAADFDAREYWRHVNETIRISEELPALFKNYMYFGDHKQRA